jgi:hypothetical protein
MYPYERSLVQRMQGKPFALLGVNSDKDRNELKKVLVKERIGWRSWFNGGTNGGIAEAWGIQAWPSIFVIDHKGVIRYRDIEGDTLDNAIAVLLKEMDEKK